MDKKQLTKLDDMAGLTVAPGGIYSTHDGQILSIYFTDGSFICLETEFYDWGRARIAVREK